MTDTWEFKLPEDKTCWDDLKEYAATDTACATAVAAGTTVPASLKVDAYGANAAADGGWLLTGCTAEKISYKPGADATAAAAVATATDLAYGDKLADGKVTCLSVGTDLPLISFTLKGMTKKAADDETSGAMSLASAVAAGALAVAATQFWVQDTPWPYMSMTPLHRKGQQA